MKFLPRPLVQPGPTSKQVGRSLARLIATIRKQTGNNQRTTMKPEQQRIKIAEFCGWKPETRKMYAGQKDVKGWGFNAHLGLGDKDRHFIVSPSTFPDYPNDLNAMHEAEKMLGDHLPSYICFLISLCAGKTSHAVFATAAQRAEALLKTIGEWEVGA